MHIDSAIRIELFQIALLCGGLFAAYRVFLTVIYPLLAGILWQHIIGPVIVSRWEAAAQCEDIRRPSYMPLQDGQPYVMSWGLLPPPVDELSHGVRDGLLLGVFATLTPEFMPFTLTLLLALTIGIAAWRVGRHNGAERTDEIFWAGRKLLIYIGAVSALNAAHLL